VGGSGVGLPVRSRDDMTCPTDFTGRDDATSIDGEAAGAGRGRAFALDGFVLHGRFLSDERPAGYLAARLVGGVGRLLCGRERSVPPVDLAAKAQAADVEITLRVWQGMVHCFPLFAPMFPEATQAWEEIFAYIKAHLDLG
jgi:acetyl esterase/lipase